LKDAFVLRDRAAFDALFDDGAVLMKAGLEARGGEAIGRALAGLWAGNGDLAPGSRHINQGEAHDSGHAGGFRGAPRGACNLRRRGE